MIRFYETFAHWLADYYLLSGVLLALALAVLAAINQPAQRRAVTQSTLIALCLLAGLCALPGWSTVRLMTSHPIAPHEESSLEPLGAAEEMIVDSGPADRFDMASQTPPAVTQSQSEKEPTPTPVWRQISWPAIAVVAWTGGAMCVVAWLAVGSLAARRLRRNAQAAPSGLVALLREVSDMHSGGRRHVDLLTSNRIDVAVALGIWRPAVLLPAKWIETQSRDQLSTVLAHEGAHLHNHDLHWLAAGRALLILLWAQPLYWFLRRRTRLDQESLADAAAAELTTRQRYAEQLIAWARGASVRPAFQLSSAVGLWEGPSQLRRRVAVLLNEQFTVVRNCPVRWRVASALLAVFTAVALSTVTLQPAIRAEEPAKPANKSGPDKPASEDAAVAERPAKHEPNVIAGQAVDEKRKPIAGAEVFLFRINRVDLSRKLQAKTATDSDGKYRFENVIDIAKELPDGKLSPLNPLEEEFVQVYVRTPGRVAEMRIELRQQIARAGDSFDMTLQPAATLSGRVTGPDGKPIGGALVQVGNSGFAAWEEVASARTKADGTYIINDVPPFSMEEYRKKEAEQSRQMAALRSTKADSYVTFVMPPVMTVEHPNYAIKRTTYEKIPGTADVKLDPAAVIEGSVVFGDSQKPAAGAVVHASTSRPSNTLPTAEQSVSVHYFDIRADAEGKYRFGKLPAGSYDLSAEMPGWVNVGIDAFAVVGGKTSTAPNLILTKGGMISIRLIDDESGKPIALTPNMRCDISAHRFPLPKGVSRPVWTPNTAANSEGRFDLRTPPGKRVVFVSLVRVDDEPRWAGKVSAGAMNPTVVNVVEGKTVELDIPVVKMPKDPKAAITGTFQPTQPPVKEPAKEDQGAVKRDGLQNGGKVQLVQNTTPAVEKTEVKRPPGILGYGDGKADGKKSYGGSGHLIKFELPEGVTNLRGIRIHGSRYGYPQAPQEDFEITFLNEDRGETLHSEEAPYHLFKRGKESWVRVMFDKEVELPPKFWVALNFNPHQTKGVYVSYDTSTKGEYSRVGLPGDEDEPKETDFGGDWMVQLMLPRTK